MPSKFGYGKITEQELNEELREKINKSLDIDFTGTVKVLNKENIDEERVPGVLYLVPVDE